MGSNFQFQISIPCYIHGSKFLVPSTIKYVRKVEIKILIPYCSIYMDENWIEILVTSYIQLKMGPKLNFTYFDPL